MGHTRTIEDGDLPWAIDRARGVAEVFHLVIAWALEEPARVGEVAAVAAPAVLGRGAAQPDDGAPRVAFVRQRPGAAGAATPPLVGSRISRAQLRLRPQGEELEVVSVGRCPLLVRGAVVERALVRPGDTLVLRNAMVLLVARRPAVMEPSTALAPPAFAFGAADAHGIVGESPAAWRLRDELAGAARATHHVLLHGESGAGKELAARAVHALSSRGTRPLVTRNAATFPEGLVDAELFGSAKNYPHAGSPERPGLIGEADGSTLFLDEIGELPPHLQAHLLRVLDQGGEYQRLGESRARRADVRLVAATNRPLDALKHDFLARFAARVRVPGLDARVEDVPLLARHLLRRAATSTPALRARLFDEGADGPEARLDPALIDALLRHRFTHHLRELERILWVALSSSRGSFVELTPEVEAELRPAAAAASGVAAAAASSDAAATPSEPPVNEPSEAEIRAALAEADGSVTRAARRLGLKNRFVLYRLMKRYNLAGREDEAGGAGDEE